MEGFPWGPSAPAVPLAGWGQARISFVPLPLGQQQHQLEGKLGHNGRKSLDLTSVPLDCGVIASLSARFRFGMYWLGSFQGLVGCRQEKGWGCEAVGLKNCGM